ncbi:MAG: ribose 5-phosphate isomerase B [Candidatus Gastranaerophilales bacterium]|nr:ribose 5-phosphate isomerase B [Candidatus Gastranaerophilales bacterium]
MKKERIIIGSDHAGYKLKEKIKKFLSEEGYDIYDTGIYSEEPADYPLIAKETAVKVANSQFDKGILICGTGIGMCIAANKIKGIRAVVCSDTTSAKLSRLHNNANILCFGERIIGSYLAQDICKIWLETDFEGGRHIKRINLIED